MNKQILVLGGAGQLGEAFKKLQIKDCLYPSRQDLSITDPTEKIEDYLKEHNIGTILNFSAYTDVEGAEKNDEEARLVNGSAFLGLSKAANNVQARIIHISTDYVFDGKKNTPYLESDETNPLNKYGSSKLLGEEILKKHSHNYVIVRTSWLYSEFRKNFFLTIYRRLLKSEPLKVINDQFGTPTSCDQLAGFVKLLLGQTVKNQIYHLSGEGKASWHDFACEIRNIMRSDMEIATTTTKDYGSAVNRPMHSVLSKEKAKKDFGIEVLDWKVELRSFMAKNNFSNN